MQLHQRQLDLRVPAHGVAAVGTELGVDVVGQPGRHARQVAVDAGAERSSRSLEQVTEAVELVPPLQVGVARTLPRVTERGVQIAVVVLGRRDPGDQLLVLRVQARLGLPEVPRHGLEQLVDLGVDELDPRMLVRSTGRGGVEVAGPADALDPVQAVLDDRLLVELLVVAPEAAVDRQLVWSERTLWCRHMLSSTADPSMTKTGIDEIGASETCVEPPSSTSRVRTSTQRCPAGR